MTTEIILKKLLLLMEDTFIASIFATVVIALFLPFCAYHLYRVLLKKTDKLIYKNS
ncbi:MAG: hypothetical protein ACK5N8_02745 [Alphaproteobacteria bacterium]